MGGSETRSLLNGADGTTIQSFCFGVNAVYRRPLLNVPPVPKISMLNVYGLRPSAILETLPMAPLIELQERDRVSGGRIVGVYVEAPRRHGRDVGAEEVTRQVDGMTSVQQHGGLGVYPWTVDSPLEEGVPLIDLYVKDLSQGARIDERLGVDEYVVPAQHEADDRLHAGSIDSTLELV